MPTTKTLITNGTISFELNTEVAKMEMFRIAQAAGYTGGKTSFMNLLNGKVESTNGFSLVKQVVVDKAVVAKTADKVGMLKDLGHDIHVVEATTETYGTINVGKGRIQLNPLNNGSFSVMVFPKKGYANEDIVKAAGGEAKTQYVKMGKLVAKEVDSLVNKLA
ncbi:hypothetical protein DEEACLCL_00157 [Salmonella phage CRW-SP2]|nr:hypothetical protein DEEACLCL_00157 [Salmonella phage CRW-SP2]